MEDRLGHKIAVIGAGDVGRTLAARLSDAGHDVTVGVGDTDSATARSAAAAHPGMRITSIPAAADGAEVVVLAVPHAAAADAVDAMDGIDGKVIVDATNDIRFPERDEPPPPLSAAERLQPLVAGARLVKAFNTMGWEVMADPAFGVQRADLFHCGDDEDAKALVASLAVDIGLEPVDCGPLVNARLLETLATLWVWLAVNGPGRDIAFKLLCR